MFDDTNLWLMLGSMASTAGVLGFWFDRSADPALTDSWQDSQIDLTKID